MAQQKHTLYHPETGEKYETSSKVEATRLKALGYGEKSPKSSAPKSDKS